MNAVEELKEYRSFEDEIRDTLNTKYQLAMFNHELSEAYEKLGLLMAYKLIDRDDPRIEKTNKSYVAGGVDKTHRFRFDYRTEMSYIPEWLFGKVSNIGTFTLSSIEHMGKRVEGNYEGDTVFGSHPVKVRINHLYTTKQASNAVEDIEKIRVKAGHKKPYQGLGELAKNGVYRLFAINIDGSCISSYANLGYGILKVGDNGAVCALVLRYEAIIGNWISVSETIESIKNTISGMIEQEVRFALAIDSKKAVEVQNNKVSASKVVDRPINKPAK